MVYVAKNRMVAKHRRADGFGEIVKTARLVETHRDVKHNNPSVQGIHKYVNAARVGDQTMRVELTVRDYLQNDGKAIVRQIASVDIKDMDIGSASTGRTDKAGVDAELPVGLKNQVPIPRRARRTWIHGEASRDISLSLLLEGKYP
ncbi:MAG: hypothetical protein SPJ12_06945 [Duodenibacillus sp.]|nr:hypothetical protein [Duodenibacillus sp.]